MKNLEQNEFSVETVAEPHVPEVSYDRRTIQLHWATAVLVGLLWGIAQVIDLFPKGAPRIAVRSVHIVLGVLLGVVLLTRIVWRSRSGRSLPPANDGIVGYVARTAHFALYAGLVSVENLHATFANALVILAGAHALAAIVHHFILRDGVLRRMLPGSTGSRIAPEDGR
jgi:cytochrome b561